MYQFSHFSIRFCRKIRFSGMRRGVTG